MEIPSATVAESATDDARGLPVLCAPALIVGGVSMTSVTVHWQVRGFDPTAIGLALFLAINLLICFWELILWAYPDEVKAHYTRNYADREVPSYREAARIFTTRSRYAGFEPRSWIRVWSFYARYDRGYIDRRSFGYLVDTCNGFSTIVPTVFVLVMMTWQVIPARWLGIVMLAFLYQMLYGAVVYFTAYVRNGCGRGRPFGELAVFVGGSNSMWIIFPAWGIAAAVSLIITGDYAPTLL